MKKLLIGSLPLFTLLIASTAGAMTQPTTQPSAASASAHAKSMRPSTSWPSARSTQSNTSASAAAATTDMQTSQAPEERTTVTRAIITPTGTMAPVDQIVPCGLPVEQQSISQLLLLASELRHSTSQDPINTLAAQWVLTKAEEKCIAEKNSFMRGEVLGDLNACNDYVSKAPNNGTQPLTPQLLARELMIHTGIRRDMPFNEALNAIVVAASLGDNAAQCQLFDSYRTGTFGRYGNVIQPDHTIAVQWLIKLANQGHIEAQHQLGKCYAKGLFGIQQDNVQAFNWYRKAAAQGHTAARQKMIMYYDTKVIITTSVEAEHQILAELALYGHIPAAYKFGLALAHGNIANLAPIESAVQNFAYAAVNGFAPAQKTLGDCYLYGIGFKADAAKASTWYQKAAAQNHAGAQRELGHLFFQTQNYAPAFIWYKQAAGQGDLEALRALSECYLHGYGTLPDIHQASLLNVEILTRQENRVDDQSEFNKNTALATQQAYRKQTFESLVGAARQGDRYSQYQLYLCYRFGHGTAQDLNIACQWAHAAASNPQQILINDCDICKQPVTLGDDQNPVSKTVTCNHYFHTQCLKNHHTCPTITNHGTCNNLILITKSMNNRYLEMIEDESAPTMPTNNNSNNNPSNTVVTSVANNQAPAEQQHTGTTASAAAAASASTASTASNTKG